MHLQIVSLELVPVHLLKYAEAALALCLLFQKFKVRNFVILSRFLVSDVHLVNRLVCLAPHDLQGLLLAEVDDLESYCVLVLQPFDGEQEPVLRALLLLDLVELEVKHFLVKRVVYSAELVGRGQLYLAVKPDVECDYLVAWDVVSQLAVLHVTTREVALDLQVLVTEHEDALGWKQRLRDKLLVRLDTLVLDLQQLPSHLQTLHMSVVHAFPSPLNLIPY